MIARLAVGVVALTVSCACGGQDNSGTGALHNNRGVIAIEDIVAGQIGLGPLEAKCFAVDGLGFGDEFDCSAETEDGRMVLFRGRVSDGAVIDVQTLNVLTADVLGAIEVAATDVLIEDGLAVAIGALKCGNGSTLFAPAKTLELACRVLHPLTGRVHAATVTVADVNNVRVTVEVAEQPLP